MFDPDKTNRVNAALILAVIDLRERLANLENGTVRAGEGAAATAAVADAAKTTADAAKATADAAKTEADASATNNANAVVDDTADDVGAKDHDAIMSSFLASEEKTAAS